MKLIPVDPKDIPSLRDSRRGRVSYPLLKSFLESKMYCAKVDRTGIQQNLQNLMTSMGTYIRNHHMPIKLFRRSGELYLMRLDINEHGEPDPDWQKKLVAEKMHEAEEPEVELEGAVDAEFERNKGKVTR